MKGGATVALGLAGGYLLGRFRKGRWLLMAAAVTATRRRDGLLRRGAESLKSSPEIGKLAEEGKDAAVALLGQRMEGLTGMISTATRKLRGEPEEGAEEEPEGGEPEAREEREGEEPEAREEAEPEEPEAREEREGEEPEAREGREGEERRPEEPEARQERGGGGPAGRGGGRPGAAAPGGAAAAGTPTRWPAPGSGVAGATQGPAGRSHRPAHRTEQGREVSPVASDKGGRLIDQLPTEQLTHELQELAKAAGHRVLEQATGRLGGVARKLAGTAGETGKAAVEEALKGGGKGGILKGVAGKVTKGAMGKVAQAGKAVPGKIKEAVTGGGGGGGGGGQAGKTKVTNIVESIDVGVPRR